MLNRFTHCSVGGVTRDDGSGTRERPSSIPALSSPALDDADGAAHPGRFASQGPFRRRSTGDSRGRLRRRRCSGTRGTSTQHSLPATGLARLNRAATFQKHSDRRRLDPRCFAYRILCYSTKSYSSNDNCARKISLKRKGLELSALRCDREGARLRSFDACARARRWCRSALWIDSRGRGVP